METWPDAAEFMGAAYLRYSFTKGTEQEVAFLADRLGLGPGSRVLDVGCGPGRHAHGLARRGVTVHGVDISPRFVELARAGAPAGAPATFAVADARALAFDAEFDVAISLCQGGFGLVGDQDGAVLAGMARAVRPGGHVVLSAFSAYFTVRFLEDGDEFDAAAGVTRERTTLRSEAGDEAEFVLETSVFTPRELRLMCRAAGLSVEAVWSVTPGGYAERAPEVGYHEFLVVARRG